MRRYGAHTPGISCFGGGFGFSFGGAFGGVVLALALEELFEETAIWTLRSIYAELSSNRLLEGMLTLPNAGRVLHLA
jgi:hypothetical protein